MHRTHDRRLFLKSAATLAAAAAAPDDVTASEVSPTPPTEKLSVGVMGVNNRGSAIAKGMIDSGQVNIAYICDVDRRAAERIAEAVSQAQSAPGQARRAQPISDFRKILDDSSVDILVCAAPNHWHAPATVLACAAGKHVYVEKPCSHTPAEGEMAIAAARKHDRTVQMGSQRRSWPAIGEAIGKLHAGAIGEVLYARTWYNSRRESIGHGRTVAVPEWLDWELWQGPCTRQPYKDNLVHYHWHWHWHWGNGELGNNGIHGLDVARWGLGVRFPHRVTAGGGKYRHDDDQQTPDTMMVTYDFPEHKTVTWEGLSWSPLGPHDSRFGISFHGTDGSIMIRDAGYVQFDRQAKPVGSQSGAGGDAAHFADFFSAIRDGRLPHADIEQAHQSTLLCHLGNIAFRAGRVLEIDPQTGHIRDPKLAEQYWSKAYAPGWELS